MRQLIDLKSKSVKLMGLLWLLVASAISGAVQSNEMGVGLQRYSPLSDNTNYDGVVLYGKYSFTDNWQAFAEVEFLQEQINTAELSLFRQFWGLSYRFNVTPSLLMIGSLGGYHQQLEYDDVGIKRDDNDSSWLAQGEVQYAVTNRHYIGSRIRYYQLFDDHRYDVGGYYQYQFNRHWRFVLLAELAYDSDFEHDANRYNVEINYLF